MKLQFVVGLLLGTSQLLGTEDAQAQRVAINDCNLVGNTYIGPQNAAVCGEPVWSCPPGLACAAVIPAPRTFNNCSDLNSVKAHFLYFGECKNNHVDQPITVVVAVTFQNFPDCMNKIRKLDQVPPVMAPWNPPLRQIDTLNNLDGQQIDPGVKLDQLVDTNPPGQLVGQLPSPEYREEMYCRRLFPDNGTPEGPLMQTNEGTGSSIGGAVGVERNPI